MRRHLAFLVCISVLVATLALPAAADDRWILRVHPTLVDGVVKQYDLKVDKKLKEDGLYLVSIAKSAQSSVVIDARIPELLSGSNNAGHKVPVLKNGTPLINMAGNPWIAYLNQPANTIIRIPAAQGRFAGDEHHQCQDGGEVGVGEQGF